MIYDVIIIGGGPGGLSAGLWCADLGLEALLLESASEFGGQLLWTYNAIGNHLGAEPAANGRELCDRFVEQTKDRRFARRLRAEVAAADVAEKTVRLSGGESLAARALIFATGIRRRRLNIAGEDEFVGRGILRSGKLDREAVAGQTVVIVGGGDAALENALILAERSERVFLVHRRREFRARREFVEQVEKLPNINILTETELTGITGTERVAAVGLKSTRTAETRILPAAGVLIRIGVEPNTGLLRGQVELDAQGYVRVDQFCRTSVSGVFAVGDAANPLAPTVSTAVGMGAIAVKSIHSWLNR